MCRIKAQMCSKPEPFLISPVIVLADVDKNQ